jgi:hypothetical protein
MIPKAHISTFVVDGKSSIVSGAMYAGVVFPFNVSLVLIYERPDFEISKFAIIRTSSPPYNLLIKMFSGFRSL